MGQINEKDQSHAKFLLKIMNTLMENSDLRGLDIELLQNTVVANSKNAGKEFRRFLENGARVNVISSDVIDCNFYPLVPEEGWIVEQHKKQGMMVWDPNVIKLHFEKKQKEEGVNGSNLRKYLENLPVLNANVLDYLWEHQELIPENWKDKHVFFWGTIYRASNGDLYVRYLGFNGRKWFRDYVCLSNKWTSCAYAVVFGV